MGTTGEGSRVEAAMLPSEATTTQEGGLVFIGEEF